jgi:hypothetical protein
MSVSHGTIKQMRTLRFMIVFLVAVLIFPVFVGAEDSALDDAARAARVEQTKLTYPIRLSSQEKTALANHCKKAQTHMSRIKVRLEARESIISTKYNLIDLHLTAVQKRLVSGGVDTSIIDLLLTSFQRLSKEHQQAFASYQLALDDATTIDCVADPQAFKALIEDVRTKRQEFVNSINAIKDFSGADLKTSFDALRKRLNTRSLER